MLGVALLWPQLRACVGMELLPELHALAVGVGLSGELMPACLDLFQSNHSNPTNAISTHTQAHQCALTDPAFLALGLPCSPCRFVRGDAESALWAPPSRADDDHGDPRLAAAGAAGETDPLASATVVFAYSTTWRSEDPVHLAPPLHAALLRRLAPAGGPPRVTVITTDKRFRDDEVGEGREGRAFRVVRQLDVPNPEVWESTAHFHELIRPGN